MTMFLIKRSISLINVNIFFVKETTHLWYCVYIKMKFKFSNRHRKIMLNVALFYSNPFLFCCLFLLFKISSSALSTHLHLIFFVFLFYLTWSYIMFVVNACLCSKRTYCYALCVGDYFLFLFEVLISSGWWY